LAPDVRYVGVTETQLSRRWRRRLSGRSRRTLIGGLIIVVGLAISSVLAAEWRSNLARDNEKSFQSAATDLSSTLRSKLDTTIGLTRTMRRSRRWSPTPATRGSSSGISNCNAGRPPRRMSSLP